MKKIVLSGIMCALLLMINACTKLPEKVESPSLKINIVINNDSEEYLVRFTGGLMNESSSTALKNVTGTISIKDNDNNLIKLPFELETILPFSTGIVETEAKATKNEIIEISQLLSINQEELEKTKESDTIYVDDAKIELKLDSYKKVNIVNLLEGKINEEKK